MQSTRLETRHLPPDLQELVDNIITGVVALASRVNSNRGSNPLGVATPRNSVTAFLALLHGSNQRKA